METNVKEVEVVAAVENVENEAEETTQKSYDKIIKTILGTGAKRINNNRIKNVNFDEKDTYTRVSFTLTKGVPGFVTEDNGNTWKEGITNVIYVSLYAIAGALKEDPDLAWMANAISERPAVLNLIFNGANIDIIQEFVVAGQDYTNPFSSKENPIVFDHDTIINHVVKFKLGDTGKQMANTLAIKMMGF